MRVLVTGADGFVGGHLLRILAHEEGCTTVAGYLPGTGPAVGGSAAEVQQIPLDVTDPTSIAGALAVARPDAVYHLAAQSSVGRSLSAPEETWEVNATGTLGLAEALRRADSPPARLLVISSAEVYGPVPAEQQPLTEAHPLRPTTPYGASKAAAELAALQAVRDGGLEVVVARSFNHTGPGQDERFVLPSMARQLARMRHADAPPKLQVGNLEVRRDFLDVRDVVHAYRILMERGESGEAYNVCSGTARSLREVVLRLVEISQTGAALEADPERMRSVDIPLLYGSAERLHALGWSPRFTLDMTLRDLFAEAEAAIGGIDR